MTSLVMFGFYDMFTMLPSEERALPPRVGIHLSVNKVKHPVNGKNRVTGNNGLIPCRGHSGDLETNSTGGSCWGT